MKKCIVHIPYELDPNAKAAPMLRPRKMIEGFISNGYDVELVEGSSAKRKEKIKEIKKNIENGIKYDFMYAENSTMPSMMSDKNHLPLHPFLEGGFFKYIKDNNIPIGLFYRDAYWKYVEYKEGLPIYKSVPAIKAYSYELKSYHKYCDYIYVPSFEFYKSIASDNSKVKVAELPSGCEDIKCDLEYKLRDRDFSKEPLKIFYVGGIGGHYNLKYLMKSVKEIDNIQLIVCCRENEWEKEKDSLKEYMCDRIEIVHKSGSDLDEYFKNSDLGFALFNPIGYDKCSMAYKLFEYLGNLLPVVASKESSMGDFVEKNDIGWAIDYSEKDVKVLLKKIVSKEESLIDKIRNCEKVKANNLWKCRAKEVANNLEGK